jgi:hypothetical protein
MYKRQYHVFYNKNAETVRDVRWHCKFLFWFSVIAHASSPSVSDTERSNEWSTRVLCLLRAGDRVRLATHVSKHVSGSCSWNSLDLIILTRWLAAGLTVRCLDEGGGLRRPPQSALIATVTSIMTARYKGLIATAEVSLNNAGERLLIER